MAKPIHEIMAESSAGLARQRAKTRETADRKAYGLANLYARRMQGQPKTSWPGGRERYLSANHPLNEASAWPAFGSDRMNPSTASGKFINKWGMTGGPNLYSGNYPMYPTWTGGMGLIGDEEGSQGYPDYGALQYKWGYPTDMLETGRTAAEQSAKYPLGEFSGMEFPPRPMDYDADEFVDTPIEMYQPAEGTGYNPMENIEYDALHMMNPADSGEFVNAEEVERAASSKLPWWKFWNRGGIASLPYAR